MPEIGSTSLQMVARLPTDEFSTTVGFDGSRAPSTTVTTTFIWLFVYKTVENLYTTPAAAYRPGGNFLEFSRRPKKSSRLLGGAAPHFWRCLSMWYERALAREKLRMWLYGRIKSRYQRAIPPRQEIFRSFLTAQRRTKLSQKK